MSKETVFIGGHISVIFLDEPVELLSLFSFFLKKFLGGKVVASMSKETVFIGGHIPVIF